MGWIDTAVNVASSVFSSSSDKGGGGSVTVNEAAPVEGADDILSDIRGIHRKSIPKQAEKTEKKDPLQGLVEYYANLDK